MQDKVALAYAVTVHKAQGLTTDEAVLVVGPATTAEHLYVGMTRGRYHNLACVTSEPVDDGHRCVAPPGVNDVLARALGRSGAEQSATEVFRSSFGPTDDLATLLAALAEAMRQVDADAGPDRSGDISLFRPVAARQGVAASELKEAEQRLAGLRADHQAAKDQLARSLQGAPAPKQGRWWPRRAERAGHEYALDGADQARSRLADLGDRFAEAETALGVARLGHDQAVRGLHALQGAEKAQQARSAWLEAHPEVVSHVVNLLAHTRRAVAAEGRGPAGPGHGRARPMYGAPTSGQVTGPAGSWVPMDDTGHGPDL